MSQYNDQPQNGGYTGQQTYGNGWNEQPQYGAPAGYGQPQYATPGYGQPMLQTPRGMFSLASSGARLGAYLIDYIIVGVIQMVPMILAFATAGFYTERTNYSSLYGYSSYSSTRGSMHNPGLFILFLAVAVVLGVGYYIWGTARGQTFGKQAVGIKVVRADGDVPGLGTAVKRELVGRMLLALVPFYGLVDAIFVFSDARKQALHDKVGGTFVVKA